MPIEVQTTEDLIIVEERAQGNVKVGVRGDPTHNAWQGSRNSQTSHAAMAALYANRGRPVLPLHSVHNGACTCRLRERCNSAGKHPRCRKGVHAATTDPGVIAAWWKRSPKANIGIATGKPSGIDVLDIDPRNGGDDSLRELEKTNGALPETAMSITGRLGYHYLFRHNPEVRNYPQSLVNGMDIKTTGGYIVAPPSLHSSGRKYCWEGASHPDDVGIAEFPDCLPEFGAVTTDERSRRPRRKPYQLDPAIILSPVSGGACVTLVWTQPKSIPHCRRSTFAAAARHFPQTRCDASPAVWRATHPRRQTQGARGESSCPQVTTMLFQPLWTLSVLHRTFPIHSSWCCCFTLNDHSAMGNRQIAPAFRRW